MTLNAFQMRIGHLRSVWVMVLAMVLIVCRGGPLHAQERTWTSDDGKEIESFIGVRSFELFEDFPAAFLIGDRISTRDAMPDNAEAMCIPGMWALKISFHRQVAKCAK